MQSKEKKWLDVEKVLKYYIEEDDELRDRFRELKMIIEGKTKLTSVVAHNEKLANELEKAYRKIDLIRSKVLDPFHTLRDKRTNEHMLGKPAARKPPTVIVTADEIIRIDERLRSGTCFPPKLDEEEVLSEYQNEKNEEQRKSRAILLAKKRAEEEMAKIKAETDAKANAASALGGTTLISTSAAASSTALKEQLGKTT